MNITSLKDMYIAELQEARSFESMLKGTLKEMSDKASNPELQKGIQRAQRGDRRASASYRRPDQCPGRLCR
ncbi:hypothetical protein [Rhodoligotrophos ferricapiens]|uniref:hypothetical protein n=1 Tax=Rhodoligotrophos ferricapiens TaxID=3069264 RepID=UPI00315C7029